MGLHVLGVRHHSPACARLVEATLRRLRPAIVLVEGPADMNERLGELELAHRLPIAIFSYYQSPSYSHASWAPFCDYSPEWRALRLGRELGAEVRFMDLPAWAPGFGEIRNRYSDHERFYADSIRQLCRRLSLDGSDALWDHLFELPADDLEPRLAEYFRGLRGLEEDPREASREQFMSACIAWAMSQGGEVVAVCGGYHKPRLEKAWKELPGEWPGLPPVEAEARAGSYLVPYSFKRLDSFVGYESGMPSPAYYQAVYDSGPEAAAEDLLRRVCQRLRERKQQVSAADLVAAMTMARALMRLRGHAVMARTDLLDGLASALLKEAQEQPLPWSQRGPLAAGTDPVVVEIVAALSGDRQGALAEATPRPPLVLQVRQELCRLGLLPPAEVRLSLEQPVDRERSQCLHRLLLLGIPGFERRSGPDWATEAQLVEQWRLQELPGTETSLIEASSWGGTLEAAARALLQHQMQETDGDTWVLAVLLSKAVFTGLGQLGEELAAWLRTLVGQESSLPRLGQALGRLLDLWRYDHVLGWAGSLSLGNLLRVLWERGLWLLETVQGAGSAEDRFLVGAVVALRDTLLHAGPALGLEAVEAAEVMQRKSVDDAAPAALRGAALGFLWSTSEGPTWVERATQSVSRSASPSILGDYLSGLFALAREQVIGCPELVTVVDGAVQSLDPHDFFVALPALRLAFSYFPPRERDRLARMILARHGQNPDQARALTGRLEHPPEALAQGAKVQRRMEILMQRFGLLP